MLYAIYMCVCGSERRSHRSLTDDLLIYGPESRPVALNDTAILAARLGGATQRRLSLTWRLFRLKTRCNISS